MFRNRLGAGKGRIVCKLTVPSLPPSFLPLQAQQQPPHYYMQQQQQQAMAQRPHAVPQYQPAPPVVYGGYQQGW